MPRDRRSSTAAKPDTRPSFAKPPGATRASPAAESPRRDRRKSRNVEIEVEKEEFSESYGEEDLPRPRKHRREPREKAKESPVPSPEKRRERRSSRQHGERIEVRDEIREAQRHKRKASAPVRASPRTERERDRDRVKYSSGTSTGSASQLLSADSLAKLNATNERQLFEERRQERKKKEKQYKDLRATESAQKRRRRKNRDVSGAILEEGRGKEKRRRRPEGSGEEYYDEKEYIVERRENGGGGGGGMSRKKKLLIILGVLALLLIILIPVAVVVSKKGSNSGGKTSGGSSSSSGSTGVKNSCDSSNIPASAKGTYTDISTWLDTTDFNCTYTDQTVGNLSIMGLNSQWDDTKQANSNVPPLNKAWSYGQMPIRGVNLGGWLQIEPFITPSMFQYPAGQNVVDEYTLSQKLGSAAARTIEKHYATFITKQDFANIASAGLDHVRIPYPYWAVTTYSGDPYVPQIAWRYLLRGIEYARQNGLRVNLDLHSVPGSQNGWTHSGHLGSIGWLNGSDGDLNAQRSLDIHNQLSTFFAQDRYKNVVTIYGLVNEPKMLVLDHTKVLDWNKQAISIVRQNGIKQQIVFGDGFLALDDWDDMFKGVDPNLMMDTHQYQIFNVGQLTLKHQDKINLACSGWTGMLVAVNNPQTGWGPTLNGEFSQADTDCTPYLNNVGVGSRWAGTLNTGDSNTSVLTETCPSLPCSCAPANADPSQYSTLYKQFLKMFAEAQMHSFEQAQGWFYWTWKTESAPQWSWQSGLAAGILPSKAYSPDFQCNSAVPDFSGLPENY